jgi:hypothetical protein
MTALSIDVDSVELGKVLANAVPFTAARSKFPVVRLLAGRNGAVTAMATDGYTIGHAWTLGPDMKASEATIALKDASELEKLARMDRSGTTATGQHGRGRLEFTPGDCLVFTPELKGEPLILQDLGQTGTAYGSYSELWEHCAELLDRLSDNEPVDQPEAALFDPNLLARFAKVKAETETGDDAVMDMLFQEGSSPVLVKIGSTFRGAIMPVSRRANAEKQGTAGQWELAEAVDLP